MKSKITLTVGIPAHNEENNIGLLINSILKQEKKTYNLKAIVVVSDGSSDKTVSIVKKYAENDSRIKVVSRKVRLGKANGLNLIYDLNTSDLLFVPDADIVLRNKSCLDEMVLLFNKNPFLNLVSARHIPAPTKKFMGKFAVYSYLSLEDAFLQFNNGNNFYTVMSASMISKKFAKSFKYPTGTISDQNYLYAQATRKNLHKYRFAKNAEVIFTTVNTFEDWRLLGLRSVVGDKVDVSKHFGKAILEEYSLPKTLVLRTQLKWFLKHPFFMAGSVLMNIFIRLFPYKKFEPKKGIWQESKSSKVGIIV
ncbi:MAG: hypothetical protein COU81_00660 [Candidatus Portnoybacteria bacterium CG10_big_fil_rev_8_21_14_0_10_36_7]|uniref:Glycosyltransferase 2-like domain-containing protein n=1 Tax=Candidatus Portnoybacteria bacterium CG10_big_fil_rev_8_21_14_0_10_36_7 TaxID=1974812 RepID=A0A2M8KEV6_9BACT|nr:MAG: hypothetical protein COU81_00660 [Candidatus Portnoybacteria bacterium CG10_big_fil_rev_8_21_14_0_10_36_7]